MEPSYSVNPPQAYPPSMSPGKPHKPRGPLTSVVLGGLLVLVSVGFAWAFMQFQDYKNNFDKKASTVAEETRTATTAELEATFQAERDRLHNTYSTDPTLANVSIQYPRDWSFYLEQDIDGSPQIDAVFHPTVIKKEDVSTYALRLQILKDPYSETLGDYQRAIERGEVVANPVTNGSVTGVRLDGKIDDDHNGAAILFPLRDRTLVLMTESRDFVSVFETVLASLKFTP